MNFNRQILFAWFLALTLAVISCGGGGGGTGGGGNPPPPTPSVTLVAGSGTLQVHQGQSATLPISLTRGGGFTGAVRLTAENLPQGLTVGFTPSGDVTGDSATATFTASDTMALAGYSVTLRGTAVAGQPTGTVTTTVQVIAPPPSYTLSLGASSLTLQRPAQSDPISVTLTRKGGYAGSPAWSVEGMPSGLTAAFSPSNMGEPTGFTLTASSNVAPGVYSLTVRAQDGSLTATAPLGLTVTTPPPSMNLSLDRGTVTLQAGQQYSVGINIQRLEGFAEPVAFTVSGAPNGVTTYFSPNQPTGTRALLVFETASLAPAGTYSLQIQGRGATTPTIQAQVTFQLVLTASTPQFSSSLGLGQAMVLGAGTQGVLTWRTAWLNQPASARATLRFLNLPAGITVVPATIEASPAQPTPTFQVQVAAGTAPGTYALAPTVIEPSGAVVTGTPQQVIVKAQGAPFTIEAIAPKTFERSRYYEFPIRIQRHGYAGTIQIQVIPTQGNAENPSIFASNRDWSRNPQFANLHGTDSEATFWTRVPPKVAVGTTQTLLVFAATEDFEYQTTATLTLTVAPYTGDAFELSFPQGRSLTLKHTNQRPGFTDRMLWMPVMVEGTLPGTASAQQTAEPIRIGVSWTLPDLGSVVDDLHDGTDTYVGQTLYQAGYVWTQCLPGTYQLTITATWNGITKTYPISLEVVADPVPDIQVFVEDLVPAPAGTKVTLQGTTYDVLYTMKLTGQLVNGAFGYVDFMATLNKMNRGTFPAWLGFTWQNESIFQPPNGKSTITGYIVVVPGHTKVPGSYQFVVRAAVFEAQSGYGYGNPSPVQYFTVQ